MLLMTLLPLMTSWLSQVMKWFPRVACVVIVQVIITDKTPSNLVIESKFSQWHAGFQFYDVLTCVQSRGSWNGAIFLTVGLLFILEELVTVLAKPFTAGTDWDPLAVTCVAYNYPSLLIFEFRPLSWYCWSFIMSPWDSEGTSQLVYCRECSRKAPVCREWS